MRLGVFPNALTVFVATVLVVLFPTCRGLLRLRWQVVATGTLF
jgi:hypothetical protein